MRLCPTLSLVPSKEQKKESRELAYKDLREWITALDRANELTRITAPVSPYLEMAEIADRAAKLKGAIQTPGRPKVLAAPPSSLKTITGYPGARTLMNQFGSERRMKLALDVDSLDDIANRIRTLIKPQMPTGLISKLKMLPMLAEIGSFLPQGHR